MLTTKQVTTRTLLRNFKEVKEKLISRQVSAYRIEVGDEIIEMKLVKKKKGNTAAILKALDQLPKNLEVERYNIPWDEFLPEREAWTKKK